MTTLLLVFWYFLLPGLVCLDYYLSFPLWDGLVTTNIFLAIYLYFWFAGNLILASKVPYLEKNLSYDKRIRIHILGSLGVLAGLVWHVVVKFVGLAEIDWLSWILLGGTGLMFTLAILWSPTPLTRWVKLLPSGLYDFLRLSHSLGFAVLTGLSWWHIHNAGIDTMGVFGATWAYPAAALLALAIYLASWFRSLTASGGIITHLDKRPDLLIVTVEMDIPLKYRAGQFGFLSIPAEQGLRAAHPFSFLSSPGADGRSDQLRFAIKPNGDFTKGLAAMAPGAWIKINGPFGGFRPRPGRQTLLIGTGIGTVPILSILTDTPGKNQVLRALLAVNTASDLALDPRVDRSPASPPCTVLEYQKDKKLIDADLLKEELAALGSGPYEVLICSSPGLRRTLVAELAKLGIRNRQIRHETFGY